MSSWDRLFVSETSAVIRSTDSGGKKGVIRAFATSVGAINPSVSDAPDTNTLVPE